MLFGTANNLGLHHFTDPVGHSGAHWWPFWILQAVQHCVWAKQGHRLLRIFSRSFLGHFGPFLAIFGNYWTVWNPRKLGLPLNCKRYMALYYYYYVWANLGWILIIESLISSLRPFLGHSRQKMAFWPFFIIKAVKII